MLQLLGYGALVTWFSHGVGITLLLLVVLVVGGEYLIDQSHLNQAAESRLVQEAGLPC